MLLHAYPVDSRMWDDVRPGLAGQARLITPDQRGLGRSPLDGGGPNGGGTVPRPDLSVVAADVLALLDRLGLDRVVLGGCSMGGYAAMAVLRAAPERIAGLLLVNTKASADTEEARATRLSVAERAEAEGGRGWLAESMLPKLLGTTTTTRRPDVVDTVRGMIDGQPAAGVAWAQRAMAARPDSSDALRAAGVPALVVTGDEDTVVPPHLSREMAGLLPRAEYVELPGCGHLPPVEDAHSFVRTVLDWLPTVG